MQTMKILITLCMSLALGSTLGQPWMEKVSDSAKLPEIRTAFNEYWNNKPVERGKGYKQFRRWEWYWETRLLPDGNFPSSDITWKNWHQYQQSNPDFLAKGSSAANWSFKGPSSSPGGYNGIGRINCIAFHPTDPNTFWIGTPAGGLWKTTNGGTSWSTVTDNLPVLGISDIAINPTNPSIMYVATGDGDRGSLSSLTGGTSGDTKSIGVLKSIDGGLTWNATGLSWAVTPTKLIRRLIINPVDPQILIAAASDSIYRTTNGGTTWSNVQSGYFMDAEFKPGDPTIVYAATYATGGNARIYRSINSGSSWTQSISIPSVRRINLAVTPNRPTLVDALCSNLQEGLAGLWFSDDSGVSFTQYLTGSTSNNMLHWSYNGSGSGGQGSYDLAYAINPANYNDLWLGGINTWNSTDGGTNWAAKAVWTPSSSQNPFGLPVTHADKHFFAFHPLVAGTLFDCNDGGLYKTTDGGATWTDLSNGLGISQIYRIGTSATVSNNVMTGLQDNGTKQMIGTSFFERTGGDGTECIIDPTNASTMYSGYVEGVIYKTTNSFTSYSIIANSTGTGVNEEGAWITPYIMHPSNASTLLVGKTQIYQTTNGGSSWQQLGDIASITGGNKIIALAYAPSNPQVIYAATRVNLFKSSDGGLTWSWIGSATSVNLPFTYIMVDPTNPDKLYSTTGGYDPSDKVWLLNTSTSTWTNLSGTLPNVPVNCIEIEGGVNGEIYIGTDVGVFHRDNTMTDWVPFKNGLPNVVVTELEISADNKLWAGTFGRGLWVTDLSTVLPVTLVDFKANKQDKTVLLRWVTTDEVNSQKYDVERSFDGTNFYRIGSVPSNNSMGTNNYSLIDNNPVEGWNYYRLKMIDKDGSFEYSSVQSVNFSGTDGIFVMAPNPSKEFTIIQFKTPVKKAEIILFDVNGRQIIRDNINGTGFTSYKLNTVGLPGGTYAVAVVIGGERVTKQLVITK